MRTINSLGYESITLIRDNGTTTYLSNAPCESADNLLPFQDLLEYLYVAHPIKYRGKNISYKDAYKVYRKSWNRHRRPTRTTNLLNKEAEEEVWSKFRALLKEGFRLDTAHPEVKYLPTANAYMLNRPECVFSRKVEDLYKIAGPPKDSEIVVEVSLDQFTNVTLVAYVDSKGRIILPIKMWDITGIVHQWSFIGPEKMKL